MVQTRGVRTYNCPSDTFELGDLIGVDELGGATMLEDQQVDGVAPGIRASATADFARARQLQFPRRFMRHLH